MSRIALSMMVISAVAKGLPVGKPEPKRGDIKNPADFPPKPVYSNSGSCFHVPTKRGGVWVLTHYQSEGAVPSGSTKILSDHPLLLYQTKAHQITCELTGDFEIEYKNIPINPNCTPGEVSSVTV